MIKFNKILYVIILIFGIICGIILAFITNTEDLDMSYLEMKKDELSELKLKNEKLGEHKIYLKEKLAKKEKELKAKDNSLYGKIKERGNLYELSKGRYKETRGNLEITYLDDELKGRNADRNIYFVEVYFGDDLKLDENIDKEFLIKHSFDYMEGDANLIQTISSTEFIYESKKIGKKYNVYFNKNGDYINSLVVSAVE